MLQNIAKSTPKKAHTNDGQVAEKQDIGLQANWPRIRLGDHAKKIGSGLTPTGGHASYKSSGIPLIRSQNVHMNRFESSGLVRISPEQDQEMEGSRIQPGDVLLNITGASIGRCCVVPDDICPANVNQHVCIIRSDGSFDPDFLALYFTTPQFQKFIGGSQAGATRQALTKGMIEDFRVPLPPLPEQCRIATRLREQLAEVARARAAVQTQLDAAESLSAALLNEVFDDARTTEWTPCRLGDVLLRIEAGQCVNCESRQARPSEWGVLKVSAVTWDEFRPQENKVLPPGFVVPDGAEVCPGDFLISRSNTTALVGAVVLVRQTRPRLMLSDKTLRLVPRTDAVLYEFLEFLLRSSRCRKFIEENAGGASSSMKNITQGAIRNIPIVLPELERQQQIARRLADGFAAARLLRSELTARSRALGRLPGAILSEGFRLS